MSSKDRDKGKSTIHRVIPGFRRDRKGRGSNYNVLASAALVSMAQLKRVAQTQGWQEEAWIRYDQIPELRYGAGWLSNACSRTRLYVGEIDPNGSSEPIAVEDGDQVQLPLDELFGGQIGHSEMLRRLAIHLNIPGESYLVGFDHTNPDTGKPERRWVCASSDEIDNRRNPPKLRLTDSDEHVDLDPSNTTIIRLWRPHPRIGWEADSPVRGLRGPLKQLLDLDAHVSASAQSRLAGAGILFVPDDISLAAPAESDGVNPVDGDPFLAALIEAMVTPLNNRDSAAAVVPLVARVPRDALKAIQHVKFDTPFDARVDELRTAAIRRIASGLDIPPEVMLGLGDVNHWSAWQIEESAVKLHVEPLLALICDALTTRYLRPSLEKMGHTDAADYAIWFDTSDVVMRANKGPDAIALYDKGLLSAEATLRENGFSEEDAPDDDEARLMFLKRIALDNDYLTPYILPMLGIDLPQDAFINDLMVPGQGSPQRVQGQTSTPSGGGGSPTGVPAIAPGDSGSSGSSGGGRSAIPQTGPNSGGQLAASAVPNAGPDEALVGMLELAVRYALGRAGKWMLRQSRAYRGKYAAVAAHDMHLHIQPQTADLDSMLHGAYAELHETVPDERVHRLVDDYVRFLLVSGREYARADLAKLAATVDTEA